MEVGEKGDIGKVEKNSGSEECGSVGREVFRWEWEYREGRIYGMGEVS